MPDMEEEYKDPTETWLTDEELPGEFNWQWREVIDGVMNNLPGYQAYAKAYEINITEEKSQRVARSNYSRLLTNANFRKLWRRILDEAGLNDEAVDSQLNKLISGPDVEKRDKLNAIKHYNELKGRIIRRTDLTSGDKPIPIMGATAVLPEEPVPDGVD